LLPPIIALRDEGKNHEIGLEYLKNMLEEDA
jgi:hypothetical protein